MGSVVLCFVQSGCVGTGAVMQLTLMHSSCRCGCRVDCCDSAGGVLGVLGSVLLYVLSVRLCLNRVHGHVALMPSTCRLIVQG